MSVEPLSDKDISYLLMTDAKGIIRDTTHAHIRFLRLKELFAELKLRINEPFEAPGEAYWSEVEELFGSLVSK